MKDMAALRKDFALNISRLRIERNLPQKTAAKQMGIGRNTLVRAEDLNAMTFPRLEIMLTISSFYSVSLEALIQSDNDSQTMTGG